MAPRIPATQINLLVSDISPYVFTKEFSPTCSSLGKNTLYLGETKVTSVFFPCKNGRTNCLSQKGIYLGDFSQILKSFGETRDSNYSGVWTF